jgi:hypothetical protein
MLKALSWHGRPGHAMMLPSAPRLIAANGSWLAPFKNKFCVVKYPHFVADLVEQFGLFGEGGGEFTCTVRGLLYTKSIRIKGFRTTLDWQLF